MNIKENEKSLFEEIKNATLFLDVRLTLFLESKLNNITFDEIAKLIGYPLVDALFIEDIIDGEIVVENIHGNKFNKTINDLSTNDKLKLVKFIKTLI